ncbi:MAG: hypothetical protein D6776_08100 [Planctomycetota bacterium]|nr:MAG: hypothetical protein D6776_08100 [Planctomycetota bacterium]
MAAASQPQPLRRRIVVVAATIALLSGAGRATAQTTSGYSGDTTGRPRWTNPLSGNPAVYEPREVHVTRSGVYTIYVDWGRYDGFLFLYETAFDVNDWTRNFLDSSDDYTSAYDSQITRHLDAGLTYVLVHSAYGAGGYGPYVVTVTGPGSLLLGPAPAGTGGGSGSGTGTSSGGGSGTGTGSGGGTATGGGSGSGTGTGTGGTGSAQPPIVSSIAPGTGPEAGGTSVQLQGSGFTGAQAVRFGTSPASGLQVLSDQRLRCVTPPGIGVQPIVVQTPAGTSAANVTFAYLPALPPTLSTLQPDSGLAVGGTPVTITGSGFGGASAVRFGPRTAASLQVVSDHEIRCVTPPGTGVVPVYVTTPTGTNATPLAFSYLGAAPATKSGGGGCTLAAGSRSPAPLACWIALLATLGVARRWRRGARASAHG